MQLDRIPANVHRRHELKNAVGGARGVNPDSDLPSSPSTPAILPFSNQV